MYESIAAHDPRQLFARDSRVGLNTSICSLGLHGVRISGPVIPLFGVVCTTIFTAFLLELLLGAGFIYGVCGNVVPMEDLWIQGMVWTSPLSCG